MSLVAGMGVSGLTSCCFLCNRDRSKASPAVSACTEGAFKRSQAWAEAYLRPLHDSINKMSALKT
jgi:hypothetical protein